MLQICLYYMECYQLFVFNSSSRSSRNLFTFTADFSIDFNNETRYSWFKINIELITSYDADDDSSAKPE